MCDVNQQTEKSEGIKELSRGGVGERKKKKKRHGK